VMEEVDGRQYSCFDKNVHDKCKPSIQTAFRMLHDKGFVHGDARMSNIMIDKSEHVKIIDFDWSGRIGDACYPFFLNHVNITWPDGATDGEHIQVAHDEYWIKQL